MFFINTKRYRNRSSVKNQFHRPYASVCITQLNVIDTDHAETAKRCSGSVTRDSTAPLAIKDQPSLAASTIVCTDYRSRLRWHNDDDYDVSLFRICSTTSNPLPLTPTEIASRVYIIPVSSTLSKRCHFSARGRHRHRSAAAAAPIK